MEFMNHYELTNKNSCFAAFYRVLAFNFINNSHSLEILMIVRSITFYRSVIKLIYIMTYQYFMVEFDDKTLRPPFKKNVISKQQLIPPREADLVPNARYTHLSTKIINCPVVLIHNMYVIAILILSI